ncbi:5808_t:CDS:2 [Ambispora leptoticha]|uniref:5808_t:CDS:1 n=1 Tax=Ambispora leptoticha TaxID=144679 RepID=A0A9N9BHT8_9GLOM|nr:5808_t:CDS:2 [Ambispora leptoticha]
MSRAETVSSKLRFYSIPQSIVSIDIGSKNLAYVHLTKDLRILDWQLHQFDLKVLEIGCFGPSVLSFVHDTLLPKQNIENLGSFVLERQPFRTFASSGILKLITLETTLYTVLLDRAKEGVSVESLTPIQTARFVDARLGNLEKSEDDSNNDKEEKPSNSKKKKLNKESKTLKKSIVKEFSAGIGLEDDHYYTTWLDSIGKSSSISNLKRTGNRNRKRLSKSIVKNWLADHKNLYTDEQFDYYNNAKKKDDLTDCLLQALSYYNYRKTSLREAFRWIDSQQTK